MFLALMAIFTLISLRLGEDGTGYFPACLIAAFAVHRLADTTFDNLNYLTFIANNSSIEPARGHGRRSTWRVLRRRPSARARQTDSSAMRSKEKAKPSPRAPARYNRPDAAASRRPQTPCDIQGNTT